MDAIAHLPNNTEFKPSMEGHYLASLYAGEIAIALVDLRYVSFTLPPVEPPPVPTPTPPALETYVVTIDALNVRVDHSLTAGIVRRVTYGKDLVLIVGEKFDDTDKKILWRKTSDNDWAAIERDGAIYAKPTLRGG
jgi:hypothetical protein